MMVGEASGERSAIRASLGEGDIVTDDAASRLATGSPSSIPNRGGGEGG